MTLYVLRSIVATAANVRKVSLQSVASRALALTILRSVSDKMTLVIYTVGTSIVSASLIMW